MRRALVPLLAFCLGLVGLTGAAVFAFLPDRAPLGVPGVGGPFTLVDQDGRNVTERDFAGATHLLFFGFTHCPDVCPTTLQQISDVLAALGPKGERMRVAFVTVDPERDTPAVAKQLASTFHPRAVGLTGSVEDTRRVAQSYGVSFSKREPAPGGGYLVDHSRSAYLMAPDGKPIALLGQDQGPAAVSAVIRHWVK